MELAVFQSGRSHTFPMGYTLARSNADLAATIDQFVEVLGGIDGPIDTGKRPIDQSGSNNSKIGHVQ